MIVKNNIISVIRTIESQSIVENIVRDDLFTGLKSEEYLYGEGKRKIDEFTTSAVCMFEIKNIADYITDTNDNDGISTFCNKYL